MKTTTTTPGAYRGYLIQTTLAGKTFISCGGALIGWAEDAADARRIVDHLLD